MYTITRENVPEELSKKALTELGTSAEAIYKIFSRQASLSLITGGTDRSEFRGVFTSDLNEEEWRVKVTQRIISSRAFLTIQTGPAKTSGLLISCSIQPRLGQRSGLITKLWSGMYSPSLEFEKPSVFSEAINIARDPVLILVQSINIFDNTSLDHLHNSDETLERFYRFSLSTNTRLKELANGSST